MNWLRDAWTEWATRAKIFAVAGFVAAQVTVAVLVTTSDSAGPPPGFCQDEQNSETGACFR